MTFFQIPFQVVHLHKVLLSEKIQKKRNFLNFQEINIHFRIFEQLFQEKLQKGLSFL